MFIHKYTVGDRDLYMISDKASKPSKIMSLSPDDWKGRSSGAAVSNAVKFLKEIPFKKEDTSEDKKAEVVGQLDSIADEIQKEDPIIAYLIDRVSDSLGN